MASDRLFALALDFRKARLWDQLFDTELFAFVSKGGEECYCCVMGSLGQHLALGVYPGPAGLDSFRQILEAAEDLRPALRHELLYSQRCVQCSFEGKDFLTREQLEQARSYARRNGISFRGKNAFPCFTTYRPLTAPWPLEDEGEEELLCDALRAALEVSRLLRTSDKWSLGFRACSPCEGEVPLLTPDGAGGYTLGRTTLPAPVEPDFPMVELRDEVTCKRLSRLKQKGIWQCEVVPAPAPVESPEGGAPRCPLLVLCWDSVSDRFFNSDSVFVEGEYRTALLEQFCEMAQQINRRPRTLLVRDARTRALLADLAQKLGINLTVKEELDRMDQLELELFGDESGGEDVAMELEHLADVLLEMDVDTLAGMPENLRQHLMLLEQTGMLPLELSEKLHAAFAPPKARGSREPISIQTARGRSKRGMKSRRKACEGRSYVLSVSLGAGCYRHIRLSGACTLAEVSQAILDAFEFDNDHLHMFCMDNRGWQSRDSYPLENEEGRDTRAFLLGELGLEKGAQFQYLFDFGDEWWFRCKVLRILEEGTDAPEIVRSHGDAPSQYGDEDDWDDDE